MSLIVSVTVFWSCSNTARWTSFTPARNRLVKAGPPTSEVVTLSMIGRNASRSASLRNTT
jgi:hypothetical protein